MSAVMRAATRPEVAESFPRAFGLKTKRRNVSPAMPTTTAKAHAAANAPYQLCAGVAFSSPRKPSERCSALTQAKTRNPHTTAAWRIPTRGRSRTTRYCRMTSTNTRHSRLGILSSEISQRLVKIEESRRLTVARNNHTLPMQRASNAALERPPKGTTAPKAIATVVIIQYSSLVLFKRKPILVGCSERWSFFYRHLARVQAYMNTDYRWKEAIRLDSISIVRVRKEPTCNIGTWGTRSLPFPILGRAS